MSDLICTDCKYNFGICTREMGNWERCPICGSSKLELQLRVSDKLEFHENVKGRGSKIKETKKYSSEFQAGQEKSRSSGKWVDKNRQIDRVKDMYHEVVRNRDTGEIIHECHEKLSKHIGHGSAKNRQKKLKD